MVKKQYRLIFQAWEAFIRNGIFQDDDLEAPIARSWQRCREYALNPHAVISHQLTLAEIYRRKEQCQRLYDIASVFMQDLCGISHEPKSIIALLDRDGYILKLAGDEELQKQCPFLQAGENWREKYKGTNAIGLVLLERSAMLVQATEHYSSLYHKMASFAAPVFDLNGDILAVLAIFGYYRHTNNHTLGMAITAARAIESRLRCEYACRGKDDPSYNASAIIESMDEGIISFDTEGRITHFNSVASKMLQIPPDSLAGSRLDELMQNSDMAEMLLRKGKKIYDQEFLVESRGKRLHFLVGGRAIKNNQGDILGGVLTLRGIHHVRNLVTRMLGAQARYNFEDIIGSSPAITDTIKLAKRVAGSSVTILLQGESGTGKELFAQAMHNAGPCPKGPFVVINCGAIPKELMESELFGFEEGAFTGARRGGQPGKFELASGGTIFLDEIAEFPLESQVALLRVLQEKVIVRVGGSKPIPVELRVIAATNKDLLKEVNKDNFRQDLYYRLNVIALTVPPLRERKNDIIELARFFARVLGEQIGKTGVILSIEVEKLFLNYPWPGNVRELRNAIERAVNISMSSVIESDHLPEKIRLAAVKSGFTEKLPAAAGAAGAAGSEFKQGLISLEEAEKKIILDTLNHLNGNVTRCAKILGISRNTMYRKMREMNMHMEESHFFDH